MLRDVIQIDQEKCNGCGNCITNCHEGALQIIDNKAVLISELMCDGLGACIGHCPVDALKIEKHEVQPYSETEVMKKMVIKGKNVVFAHLSHLKQHEEFGYVNEGLRYLLMHQKELSFNQEELREILTQDAGRHEIREFKPVPSAAVGCPGSQSISFDNHLTISTHKLDSGENQESQLTHWPIQMHLIHPGASHFRNADLLLAADCVAYSYAGFHSTFLTNKKLAIACPKLDSNKEVYVDKLIQLIDEAKINTITVMIMEVPCCGGLLQLVKLALSKAIRKVPLKSIIISTQGAILNENWI